MYIYICIDILECSPPVTVTSKVNRYPLLQMKPLWWLLLLCEEHICIYIYVYIFIYRCEYACHTQWKCINKDSKELNKKNITSTKKQLCGTAARSGLLATAKLLLRCLGLQVVFSCHPECVVHPD